MSATTKYNVDGSIPFVAAPWAAQTYIISSGFAGPPPRMVQLSDRNRILSSNTFEFIRLATPYGNNTLASHLNLQMSVGSALSVKIAIGYFETDGYTAETTYPAGYVDQQHEFLTGSSSPIASSGGVLLIDALNIYHKIPKRGDANFNEYGFVLLLQFDRARTVNDEIVRFEVSCSGLMGLL